MQNVSRLVITTNMNFVVSDRLRQWTSESLRRQSVFQPTKWIGKRLCMILLGTKDVIVWIQQLDYLLYTGIREGYSNTQVLL